MKDLSKPFSIPSHRTSDLVAELGKMPVGGLIGNILAACVDAQTHAADTAWMYTQKTLENKDPIVFNFKDKDGMKRLEVPLFTIVPLPYLRLDNVDIEFDAEASLNTLKSNEFLISVNNTSVEGNGVNVVQGSSNLHIDINASTTDMPTGLATLLQHLGDSLIIEDLGNTPDTDTYPNTGSGINYADFDGLMNNLKANAAYFTSATDSIDNAADYVGGALLGIHVNWTKPSYRQVGGVTVTYKLEDHDILSTVLSALLWRKFNGPIKLYTDNNGLDYYKSMGMTDLWNGGIDTQTLNNIPYGIPASVFWAAGKLFAARNERYDFALLDTDLMVWQPIHPLAGSNHIMAFHPETLQSYNSCYLPLTLLKKPRNYKPDPQWDWNQNPVNTALTYYANTRKARTFCDYYTRMAIEFMTGNTEYPQEMVSQMVYAEQRVYAMCAKKTFGHVPTFMAYEGEPSKPFSHIWGNKAVVRNDAASNFQLCAELVRIITTTFPDISISPKIRAIFDKYRPVTYR